MTPQEHQSWSEFVKYCLGEGIDVYGHPDDWTAWWDIWIHAYNEGQINGKNNS